MKKLKKFKTIEEAELELSVGEEYILISDDSPEIIAELETPDILKKRKAIKDSNNGVTLN